MIPKSNGRDAEAGVCASDQQVIRRVILGLLGMFAVIGLLRLVVLDGTPLAGGDAIWQVSFTGNAMLGPDGGEVHVAPLRNTAYARVVGQSIYHPQMRQKRAGKKGGNLDIVLSSNQPGRKYFTFTFDVLVSQQRQPLSARPMKEDSREQWLIPEEGIFVDAARAVELLSALQQIEEDTNEKARYLFDYISEQVSIVVSGSDQGDIALELGSASRLGAARALVSMLRSAHLPARVVAGVDLAAHSRRQPHYWVEAYYQGQWRPMDVARGNFEQLPKELIPVTRNSIAIARLNGVEAIPLTISATIHPHPQVQPDERGNLAQIFNLLRIPPSGREALALLILLPFGVLATEFLRLFVGLRTFGVFTPSLLALAAVFTELKTAFVVFSLVILFGVAGRALLPGLELSRVSRLSVVFTMVAGIMVFAVSGLLYFDPRIDTAVVLLPIVILTSVVDRFYSVADEVGVFTAMKRLFWTVVTAAISMMILMQDYVGHWLLQYPETHLVTIASIILFGCYRGRRLADFASFRWISEPPSTKKKSRSVEEEI